MPARLFQKKNGLPTLTIMELLIPGLILVALMIYASTKIKKTAAEAFEPETVETDDFIIQKPDGFLNKLNGDPQFAFEAYSKEFGAASGAENFRMGTANLIAFDGKTVKKAISELSESGDKMGEQLAEVVGEHHYRVIEGTRVVKDIDFRVRYKLAEKAGKLYRFETVNLVEASEEFVRRIDGMLDSFELK
ncbi:hypothetical protein BH10ACI2_BH10ACI2_01920 [soil metagenome]